MSERRDDDAAPPAGVDGSTRLRDAELAPAPRTVAEILARLPTAPGVYFMKDARGRPLYIGKAASLRARVQQYFQPSSGDTRDFVPLLHRLVADIEFVVTGNEKEALLLENTLIKRHRPRFNVKLRDDSSFLTLRLNPDAPWPRLEVGRALRDDGAWYFGPYHSASAAREALRVVNRHFQLRTCTDHVLRNRRRPCLQYQIQRCPAPCVLDVDRAAYADQVRQVRLFLDGRSEELLRELRERMKEAAAALQFERAAELRDRLAALEATLQEQVVVDRGFAEQDALGFFRQGPAVEITVLSIRDGKLTGSRAFSFRDQEFPDGEVLSSFLGLYYDQRPGAIPDEILLPFPLPDQELRAQCLSELRAHHAASAPAVRDTHGGAPAATPPRAAVKLLVPARGARHERVELARKNAAASFASRRSPQADTEAALAKLARRLRLPRLPRVIECYDISHVQGTDTVASQVVFVDGEPDKGRYRTYKLRHLERAGGRAYAPGAPDDFAAMYEVLSRRFRRAREATEAEGPWALPDLIVVDGGKGQLGMALAAARDAGVDVSSGAELSIVALAKERDRADGTVTPADGGGTPAGSPPSGVGARVPDRVFLPNAKDPIPIRAHSAELFVLQRLRDEAHRFAVTFHRAQRRRRTLRSQLAAIPGIGPARQRALLRHFGSVARLRAASVEELARAPGIGSELARTIADHLARTAAR